MAASQVQLTAIGAVSGNADLFTSMLISKAIKLLLVVSVCVVNTQIPQLPRGEDIFPVSCYLNVMIILGGSSLTFIPS